MGFPQNQVFEVPVIRITIFWACISGYLYFGKLPCQQWGLHAWNHPLGGLFCNDKENMNPVGLRITDCVLGNIFGTILNYKKDPYDHPE